MKRARHFPAAACSRRAVRKATTGRCRPGLEALEDRFLPSVSYLVTDPGDGQGSSTDVTLRYAVGQAVSNNQTATITFSPTLAGQPITLVNTQTYPGLFGNTGLAIGGTADVTIDGSAAPGLTIASSTLRLFAVYRTAALSLSHLTLEGGTANPGSGGAVYDSGTFSANYCTFVNNTAASGGAIIVHTDTLLFPASATVFDCTFSGNHAQFNGGAVYVAIASKLTVSGSTFDGNSATLGGGIYCFAGTVTLTNSTFAANAASGFQSSSGGGVYSALGTLTVSDCTFSGNSATGFGGAIADYIGTFVLNNSLLANSPSGGDLFEGTPLLSSVSGGNDLIGDGSFLNLFTNSLSGNAGLDPLGLRDNGGPTQTIALLSDSQAVSAGDNALVPAGVTTDQRGAPRTAGGTVDIGAYQLVPAVGTRTTLTSSENPSTPGDPVTFTATAAAADSSLLTGTVTFFVDGAPEATVALTGGVAIFETRTLPAGRHSVTARFSGGTSDFIPYNPSASDALTQVVNVPPTPPAPPAAPGFLADRLVVATLSRLNLLPLPQPTGGANVSSAASAYSPTFPIYLSPTPSMTYRLALRDEACGGQPSEIDANAAPAPKAQPEASATNNQAAALDADFAAPC